MDIHTIITNNKTTAFSLFLTLSFLIFFSSSIPNQPHKLHSSDDSCAAVRQIDGYQSKCAYVKAHKDDCNGSDGYLNYLEIFYCTCSYSPLVGYLVVLSWLIILFYLLGNTTSDYFVPSVEGLSSVLRLSPTIAGTTLLPLGNGANDVFSSIVSFTSSGDADVGLNSVLGGAFFICCFVVGIVSISVSSRGVAVDRNSFVRDVIFFLFVLCCLLIIIAFGRINLWFALCFLALYSVYMALVFVMQSRMKADDDDEVGIRRPNISEIGGIEEPFLIDEEKGNQIRIGSEQSMNSIKSWCSYFTLPLDLPRRLTIPLVNESNWSKPIGVISATLAPILLSTLIFSMDTNFQLSIAIFSIGSIVGFTLGALVLVFTKRSNPPAKCLLPWLVGGFVMSILWTYVIVEELVALLVAFGNILGVSPAILGFTILAWGNSVGDLVSNLTMAVKGGADGAQVAVSGCYAGPLFNTLVGLGISMVLTAWAEYPSGYEIPRNSDLYETVGFLMVGLLWALVMLPKRDMKLDKSLGVGLLAIYFCFLFIRLAKTIGFLNLG